MDEEQVKVYVEQLLDYIMKKCLWQFHSRAWDRERQNKNILAITTRLLCGDDTRPSEPEARCYWADAVTLAAAYRQRFDWIADLTVPQIEQVMKALRERLDFLTITGSLNQELTDAQY